MNLIVRFLKTIACFVLLLLCASCSVSQAIPATDYLSLLRHVKDLLSFCILILGLEPCYKIQLIPRYYYAIYNLARLVYNNTLNCDSSYHRDTWKQMPSSISQEGNNFRNERNKNDYNPYTISDKDLYNQLSMIETSTILDNLVKEVSNTVNKYQDFSPNFDRSQFEKNVNSLLSEIRTKNDELKKKINRSLNNNNLPGSNT